MAVFPAAAGRQYEIVDLSGAQVDTQVLASSANRQFVIYSIFCYDVSGAANTTVVADENNAVLLSKEIAASGDAVVIYPAGLILPANKDVDVDADGSLCIVIEYLERSA